MVKKVNLLTALIVVYSVVVCAIFQDDARRVHEIDTARVFPSKPVPVIKQEPVLAVASSANKPQ